MNLDLERMTRALRLARRGLYSTHPNPRVGCVIVAGSGEVVGEGCHLRAGEPHAEVHALRQAGERAQGGTAYVSLEPCSHQGRTPPCVDALIAAGVCRVVAAMQDPNPQVAGNGLKRLAAAGIEVHCGLLEDEARALNLGFIKRMEQGLPFVRVKLAMSLDGRTAMQNGQSQWITGAAARAAVQRLRAQSSVVLSGADTVLADGARLTVRPDEMDVDEQQRQLAASRSPLRVLLDSGLRVPLAAPFYQAGRALTVCHQINGQAQRQFQAAGQELLAVPGDSGRIDLPKLLRLLSERGVNEVLVEAGATLSGAFAKARLVDEYHLFIAPKLLGSTARPLLDLPLERLSEAHGLDIVDIRAIGEDFRVIARPRVCSRFKRGRDGGRFFAQ